MTKFTASFAVLTAGVAKFKCGYYEAHPKLVRSRREFKGYKKGVDTRRPVTLSEILDDLAQLLR